MDLHSGTSRNLIKYPTWSLIPIKMLTVRENSEVTILNKHVHSV